MIGRQVFPLLRKLAGAPARRLHEFTTTFRGPFHGVYDSYEAAVRAIPKGARVGHDHADMVRMYMHTLGKARTSDYPVLFWLSRILTECTSVFDYGGHVGVSYYRFAGYLTYPKDLQWRVCDMPEITKAGEEIARERGNPPLLFCNQFAAGDGAEVLLGFGVLQYAPTPLAHSLRGWDRRPKHILINRVPLYPGPAFVTLENPGFYCPYQVFNYDEFVKSICDLGYELVDSWLTPDWPCHIPWNLSRSFDAHSGLYFRAQNANPDSGHSATKRSNV